jgi:hypothetical protein
MYALRARLGALGSFLALVRLVDLAFEEAAAAALRCSQKGEWLSRRMFVKKG